MRFIHLPIEPLEEKRFIYLPIEPLEERYSAQMYRWVIQDLEELGYDYKVIMPDDGYKVIREGQWLDTYGATDYRLKQMKTISLGFEEKLFKNGDIFLIGDTWFPGIETIRFLAEMSGIMIKVVGWHYAGMFDPHDLLANKLSYWASAWERWLFQYLDAVCVGSKFHKGLIHHGVVEAFPWWSLDHVRPYGLVWKPAEVAEYKKLKMKKEKIVVFPHRFAPEKQPYLFEELAGRLNASGWDFVYSTNSKRMAEEAKAEFKYAHVALHENKDQYYRFLSKCSIYYSAGLQETFGYSLHEAIALGLAVVAPDRCSYSSMLNQDERFLYNTDRDPIGETLLKAHMDNPVPVPYSYTEHYSNSCKHFLQYCADL